MKSGKVVTVTTFEAVRCIARGLAFGGATVVQIVDSPDTLEELIGLKGFVPGLIPGEHALVQINKRQPKFFEGTLLQLEAPFSPSRVDPPCPVFGQCGGCDLQHIVYQEQLNLKQEMLVGAMRSGRISEDIISTVKPIVSSNPYGYRRRITLHKSSDGEIGFFHEKSHEVIPITECLISSKPINQALKEVIELGEKCSQIPLGIKIEADDDSAIVILSVTSHEDVAYVKEHADTFLKNYSLLLNGKFISDKGNNHLTLKDDYVGTRSVPVGSFSQVNWEINRVLVERVIEILKSHKVKKIEDLYSGSGNFSLPAASSEIVVDAVESDPRLCEFGTSEALRLGFEKQIQFHCMSVERYIKKKQNAKIDALIVDPPRSGIKSISNDLNRAPLMILISCDMLSFVRDINSLTSNGWSVEVIEPFDMFAQTTYLEILTVLHKE